MSHLLIRLIAITADTGTNNDWRQCTSHNTVRK